MDKATIKTKLEAQFVDLQKQLDQKTFTYEDCSNYLKSEHDICDEINDQDSELHEYARELQDGFLSLIIE